MSECYGFDPFVAVIFDNSGEILAGLPIMKTKSWLTGNRWVSLPFSDQVNLLYKDEPSREEFTSQMIQFIKEDKIRKMEIRCELPARPEITQHSRYVFHTLQLDPDSMEIRKHFRRSNLQNIHTAVERGVEIEFGTGLEHLKAFYTLHVMTRKKHGAPVQPWKYFSLLGKFVLDSNKGFILLARKDNEYIAGMVCLHWNKTLIAKYCASREDCLNLRPNNCIFWEMIRWGCENGYSILDLGRSKISDVGLRNFKIGWSAIEKPLTYSTMGIKQSLFTENKLESICSFVISRSPLWVCRISGEILYKHFG